MTIWLVTLTINLEAVCNKLEANQIWLCPKGQNGKIILKK